MISARIENKDVYPLIHAAEETYSTGDESLAEVYSCKKVPLLYESLYHKMRLRKMQLSDIFDAYGKYACFEKNVVNMNNKVEDYLQISALLTAKKDPKVQKSLATHLTKVYKNWNFKENLLKRVKKYTREALPRKKELLIIENDFRIWPIGKKFYCPLHLFQLANIDIDGKVNEKTDNSNREIYEQWKAYTFKYERFDDGYLLEITL